MRFFYLMAKPEGLQQCMSSLRVGKMRIYAKKIRLISNILMDKWRNFAIFAG